MKVLAIRGATTVTSNNKEDFLVFIAQIEKESLERYLSIIQPV